MLDARVGALVTLFWGMLDVGVGTCLGQELAYVTLVMLVASAVYRWLLVWACMLVPVAGAVYRWFCWLWALSWCFYRHFPQLAGVANSVYNARLWAASGQFSAVGLI